MKKWLFLICLFLLVTVKSVSSAYAQTLYVNDGQYMLFDYSIEQTETNCYMNYYIEYTISNLRSDISTWVNLKRDDNVYGLFSFTDLTASEKYNDAGELIYYLEGTLDLIELFDISYLETDIVYVNVLMLQTDGSTLTCELIGDNVGLTPEPTPEETPTPEPTPEETITPEPDPTVTPTPTPTNTPTPTPTNTPTPTPTNTPTPSPTPAPTIILNAYIDESGNAVAEYQIGGCTPVKSVIALYEMVNRDSYSGTLVEQEVFLSGTGTMSEAAVAGKLYRYKLTYTFNRNGVQYTEELWSVILEITDDEWEQGYISTGNISTFRELMYFIWNELMALEVVVEGFKFSLKSVFIWITLAGILLFLVFKFLLD